MISSYGKKAFYALSLLTFVFSNGISQETSNTSAIQKLEVSYKEPDLPTMDSVKMVRMQSVITFENDSSIKKIHLKIVNPENSNIIYQVDYDLDSQVIKNEDNIILFKRESKICYINSSPLIPLELYQYQITTENSQGILSEVFAELH